MRTGRRNKNSDDVRKVWTVAFQGVILGTSICENPLSAEKIYNEFGPEKIVAGIDAKNGKAAVKDGLKIQGPMLLNWLQNSTRQEFPGIIYTDIATDGMLSAQIWKQCPNLRQSKILQDYSVWEASVQKKIFCLLLN
jgi:phosphoribosylformimino-5-aminoimidazole carboxamide ribotide isomerase